MIELLLKISLLGHFFDRRLIFGKWKKKERDIVLRSGFQRFSLPNTGNASISHWFSKKSLRKRKIWINRNQLTDRYRLIFHFSVFRLIRSGSIPYDAGTLRFHSETISFVEILITETIHVTLPVLLDHRTVYTRAHKCNIVEFQNSRCPQEIKDLESRDIQCHVATIYKEASEHDWFLHAVYQFL